MIGLPGKTLQGINNKFVIDPLDVGRQVCRTSVTTKPVVNYFMQGLFTKVNIYIHGTPPAYRYAVWCIYAANR